MGSVTALVKPDRETTDQVAKTATVLEYRPVASDELRERKRSAIEVGQQDTQ